jgi:hypothetical protein
MNFAGWGELPVLLEHLLHVDPGGGRGLHPRLRGVQGGQGHRGAGVVAGPPHQGLPAQPVFRRKSKHSPKGHFAYPAVSPASSQARYSQHWVSEVHRNAWHVLQDATALTVGEDRLPLSLHRPDFVLCTLGDTTQKPAARVTCLLVRRRSFDTSLPQQPEKQ